MNILQWANHALVWDVRHKQALSSGFILSNEPQMLQKIYEFQKTVAYLGAGFGIFSSRFEHLCQRFQRSFNICRTPRLIQFLPRCRYIILYSSLPTCNTLFQLRKFNSFACSSISLERAFMLQIYSQHCNEKSPKRMMDIGEHT